MSNGIGAVWKHKRYTITVSSNQKETGAIEIQSDEPNIMCCRISFTVGGCNFGPNQNSISKFVSTISRVLFCEFTIRKSIVFLDITFIRVHISRCAKFGTWIMSMFFYFILFFATRLSWQMKINMVRWNIEIPLDVILFQFDLPSFRPTAPTIQRFN